MPSIKRYILLTYEDTNYQFWNTTTSDFRAVKLAIEELEKKLGKIKGSLNKYFKENKNNIVVKIL
jgi:hypothetical protein